MSFGANQLVEGEHFWKKKQHFSSSLPVILLWFGLASWGVLTISQLQGGMHPGTGRRPYCEPNEGKPWTNAPKVNIKRVTSHHSPAIKTYVSKLACVIVWQSTRLLWRVKLNRVRAHSRHKPRPDRLGCRWVGAKQLIIWPVVQFIFSNSWTPKGKKGKWLLTF